MEEKYLIRVEEKKDYEIVENLTRECFWNIYRPGCTEHYVLHCYRNNPDYPAFFSYGNKRKNYWTYYVFLVIYKL